MMMNEINHHSDATAVAQWISSIGETFKVIASIFIENGVTGEDLFDEEVVNREAFDDMLQSVSIKKFAKNKLWKKIEKLRSDQSEHRVRDLTENFPNIELNATAVPFQPTFKLLEQRQSGSQSLFSSAIEPPAKVAKSKKMSYAQIGGKSPVLRRTKPNGKPTAKAKPPVVKAKKMVCWRALNKSEFSPEALETFLQSKFNVCFQYQHKTQKFSIYGEKSVVRLAISALSEKKIDHGFMFEYEYEMDTFELHLSTRAVQTLLDHKELQNFVKENQVILRCEPMNKTKSNGEKQCKLLVYGAKWPEAAMQVKDILGRDYSRVFTNYVFTTAHPQFDAIMHDRHDPFWRVISRDTETNVRTLTKTDFNGKRHVLISGKVLNVMRAKEMLELRLSFQK
jgi:hypothetical protein